MGETDIETMANVTISKYDFDDDAFRDVSSEAIDFITRLLVKDAEARMTATECLEHKWLKRRPPRPIPATKPLVVPPPKFIKDPSPVPASKIQEPQVRYYSIALRIQSKDFYFVFTA